MLYGPKALVFKSVLVFRTAKKVFNTPGGLFFSVSPTAVGIAKVGGSQICGGACCPVVFSARVHPFWVVLRMMGMEFSENERKFRRQVKELSYAALDELCGGLGANGDSKAMEDRLLVLRVVRPALRYSMGYDVRRSDVVAGLLEYLAWSDWYLSPEVDAFRRKGGHVSWGAERWRRGFT
jgi:hypothetical protein